MKTYGISDPRSGTLPPPSPWTPSDVIMNYQYHHLIQPAVLEDRRTLDASSVVARVA